MKEAAIAVVDEAIREEGLGIACRRSKHAVPHKSHEKPICRPHHTCFMGSFSFGFSLGFQVSVTTILKGVSQNFDRHHGALP